MASTTRGMDVITAGAAVTGTGGTRGAAAFLPQPDRPRRTANITDSIARSKMGTRRRLGMTCACPLVTGQVSRHARNLPVSRKIRSCDSNGHAGQFIWRSVKTWPTVCQWRNSDVAEVAALARLATGLDATPWHGRKGWRLGFVRHGNQLPARCRKPSGRIFPNFHGPLSLVSGWWALSLTLTRGGTGFHVDKSRLPFNIRKKLLQASAGFDNGMDGIWNLTRHKSRRVHAP